MKNIAVYTRVSTELQKTDSQIHAIKKWLKETEQTRPVSYYEDLGISGSKSDRPAFQRMLEDCRAGLVDTVVVYKLDRLSRVTTTALKLTIEFDELEITFVSVTQPMFSESHFRYVMISLFAEMAQKEREAIHERQAAGIAARKAKGLPCGRVRSISDESVQMIRALGFEKVPYRTIAAKVGVSLRTVQRYLIAS